MEVPVHIAIIMDGNGRWAKARNLPRSAGHRAGVEALRRAVRSAGDIGIPYLTVYAFSSENWARPQSEVNDLLGLLKLFIRRDLADLHKNGVHVRMIGQRDGLASDIRALIEEAEALTAANTGLTLIIAFNYGSRNELTRAAQSIARQAAAGTLRANDIDEGTISALLDTHDFPDPDLVIRTSGEQRLSNFMAWQAAYSELVFLPCYWPDFNHTHMLQAVDAFSGRVRRFGGLVEHDVAL